MKLTRDHKIAAATAALALGVPAGAALWISARTDQLATRVGERGAIDARIGSVDADLTGTIRLSDVALGELFAADSVEASVALDSLLAGQLSADEVRVAGPRIALEIDREGDSDLARLVRRLGHTDGAPRPDGPPKLRRIVVTSGSLTARLAGIGELSADAVELVPDGQGVRLITGPLQLRTGIGNGRARATLELARSAAEVSLPRVTFGRMLAVAGTGTIAIGDRTVALRDLAIGRLAPGAPLDARGLVDDAGVMRSFSVELAPPSGGAFALVMRGENLPLAPLATLAPHGLVLGDARASGELTLRGTGRTLQLATHAAITGLRIDHEAFAPQPVTLAPITLDATLAVSPDAITVDRASLALGAATWTASGWLGRTSPVAGQLDVQLEPAACKDLFASIPPDIRGPLDGLALAGTFSARARLSIDLAAPVGDGVALDTSLANACEVLAEPPGADVDTLAKRPPEGAPWIALDKLPRFVAGAFVSTEDGRFWTHDGFDLTQIARSFEVDLRDRRLARGGSTISQQLVKNELLTHRRTLDRKIQEALLTWRLEARLDKKQILERYLNIIELGPKVHGLVEAARYWFDATPRELTVREAAFLAALTAEPRSMSRRVREAGGLDPESAARVDGVLRAMKREGVISQHEHDAARDKPLRFASTALRRDM